MPNNTQAWAADHETLIQWLMAAEKHVKYGYLQVYYHQGEIVGYEISTRERWKKEGCEENPDRK
jgi:hypothetical protein